jgi:hypothetical protein
MATSELNYESVDVQTLKTLLAAQTEDGTNTLPEDARVRIRVQYESDQSGNMLTKSGEVWGYSDAGTSEKIRFSMNAGEDNEDSYYISLWGSQAMLYSVDDYGDSHGLGKVDTVKVRQ